MKTKEISIDEKIMDTIYDLMSEQLKVEVIDPSFWTNLHNEIKKLLK